MTAPARPVTADVLGVPSCSYCKNSIDPGQPAFYRDGKPVAHRRCGYEGAPERRQREAPAPVEPREERRGRPRRVETAPAPKLYGRAPGRPWHLMEATDSLRALCGVVLPAHATLLTTTLGSEAARRSGLIQWTVCPDCRRLAREHRP